MGRREHFDADTAARELAEHGGFSRKPLSGREPRPVRGRRGVMVSEFGAEEIHPGVAGPQVIEAFRDRHMHSLKKPGRYIGGWVEGNETYLDRSVRRMGRGQAHQFARMNAQRAVYDMDKGDVVKVRYGNRVDFRGTLFEGDRSAQQVLRQGNSDAIRQQTELRLRQSGGFHDRRPAKKQAEEMKQLKLPLRVKR